MSPAVPAAAASRVDYALDDRTNVAEVLFLREVAGRQLAHVARERVPIVGWATDMLGGLAELIWASDGRPAGRKSWVLRHDEHHYTLVELYDGWANIATAAPDFARAERACRQVAEQIRCLDDDESVTPITFWALNGNGFPRAMRRTIEVPQWDELTSNYASATVTAMQRLLGLDCAPAERMILWHGPPGTGKTHALRALARAWRTWCDVSFIADPEAFFGGSPTYLFDVAKDDAGRDAAQAQQRSKLIVLEDAGELMIGDARAAAGQGLSRLLNLTDGLIGQGLKVLVLITTNEPLSILHPAVVRPGRCLAEIEFGALRPSEANAWLESHDSQATVREPATLADLYAILAGHPPRSRKEPIGFAASLAAA